MQCSRRILDAMGSVAVDVLDLLDCHKEGKSPKIQGNSGW